MSLSRHDIHKLAIFLSPLLLSAQSATDENLAGHHTYIWATAPDDRLWSKPLEAAVDRQLTAKGWRKVDASADTRLVGSDATDIHPVAMGSVRTIERADGVVIDVPPQVERKGEATLHLTFFDMRSNKVIWRSTADAKLSGSSRKDEKRMEEALTKALQALPPSTP